MYFWKYRDLAKSLKDGNVSASAYSVYVIIFLIVGVVFILPSLLQLIGGDIYGLIGLAIPTVWVITAYIFNSKGDGKNFLRRYISLFTPIVARSMVFMMSIGILVAIIYGAAGVADAMSGGNNTGFLTGNTSKGIATIFVTVVGIWFMLAYPLILYIKAFKIASCNTQG